MNTITMTKNNAGGNAVNHAPLHALAQYAFTGTFNNCFYVNSTMQFQTVLELCHKVEDNDVARIAIAARKFGYMKDMPAALCAYLHNKNAKLLAKVFDRVIDNGKMLKKFIDMVKSGKFGSRKSFGSTTANAVRKWFRTRNADKLFWDYSAMSGEMKSILKIFHPKPNSKEQEAFFSWVSGWEKTKDGSVASEHYPKSLSNYLSFKNNPSGDVPNVPFQLIEGLVSEDGWKNIAKNASWQQTRQSLNTFSRHGVFKDDGITGEIAKRLADSDLIKESKVFPYQLLAAYTATQATPKGMGWGYGYSFDDKKADDSSKLPNEIIQSLERAMEIAVSNVPVIEGQVLIALDISGSMNIPVTGESDKYSVRSNNFRSSSKIRCFDASSLIAAAVVRKNPKADILLFNAEARRVNLNFTESIFKNAAELIKNVGGGTSCGAPLAMWNKENKQGDVVIMVSDYESWNEPRYSVATYMDDEWKKFKNRCPNAKMVCIDLAPSKTSQVSSKEDILTIGGMSDKVFDHISQFLSGEFSGKYWTDFIQEIEL